MAWSLRLKTAPTAEPVRVVPDIRDHCRLTDDEAAASSADLGSKITSARVACEIATRRQLITATWTLYLDSWAESGVRFADGLHLPRPPLQSVTSVKYIDPDGDQQTWAQDATGYTVDTPSGETCSKGRIYPSYGVDWPAVRTQANAIEVEFIAGYGGAPEDVPARLREGIKRYVGELYERREEGILGQLTPTLIRASREWDEMRAY